MYNFLTQNRPKWENQTPCFVVNSEALEKNIHILLNTFKGEIAYSHKTNCHNSIIELVANMGCSFLLSSVEELMSLVRQPNISTDKLIFQSPSLTYDQLQGIRKLGVRRFIIDSEDQLRLLLGNIKSNDNVLELLIRINTGVKVKKPELSYGMDSYLGFPLIKARLALKKLNTLRKKGRIRLGVHNHLISQNTHLDMWKLNLKEITKFVLEMKLEGIRIDSMDFGGGYPVRYLKPVPRLDEISNLITNAQTRISKAYPEIHYIFEPGRKLIAESVLLITQVVHTKKFLSKDVAILNCSLYNHSLDTLIVDLNLPVAKINKTFNNAKLKSYTIRGSTPDSRDVFSREVKLHNLKGGDYLVFKNCGAYTFGSDFISLPKAKYIVI
jgi:ornithine decarboxylase